MKFTLTLFLAAGLLIGCTPKSPAILIPTTITVADTPGIVASPVGTATIAHTPRPTSTEILTITSDPKVLTQEAIVSFCAAKERTWYTKHLSKTYFTHENWGAVVCSDHGIYTKVS